MSIYNTVFYRVFSSITAVIAKINWMPVKAYFNNGKGYDLDNDDLLLIRNILSNGHYLILTKRKTHLTTYLIGLLTLIKTGKYPEYAHAVMNLNVHDGKFDLMEATAAGVHYSEFMDIFDCDSVCILEPRNLKAEDWTVVMEGLSKQLGKMYDDWFDLDDNSRVSCVEMCLDALKALPSYDEDFPNLDASIRKVKNLTPQMYYDCPDFRIVFEVRR